MLEAISEPVVLFQSTPSARRATFSSSSVLMSERFQSTPSARRATGDDHGRPLEAIISIHALREEGDFSGIGNVIGSVIFQSTPSARRATQQDQDREQVGRISIHALREEGDSKSSEKIQCFCSIIHACAQFEKELYEGSGEMQNKSC